MRWDRLFDDMAGQLAAQRVQEAELEAVEELRLMRARTEMADRLVVHQGRQVRLCPAHGRVLEGEVTAVGPGWLALVQGREQVLVPLGAVLWWEPVVSGARPLSEARRRTLGLGIALRALSRAREQVRVITGRGGAEAEIRGVLGEVGADYLEVVSPAERPASGAPRVRRRIVPLAAVLEISSLTRPAS